MSRSTRWIASLLAAVVSVPAAYVASFLLCGPTQLGTLLAATNALALIP